MGFFDKLKKINIFANFGSELTNDFYDELEESLILADTGMDTTLELVEELRRRVKEEHIKTVEEARTCMCRCIAGAMQVPLVGNWLMPDVPLWLAPLAAIWAFLTWWGRVLRSMNDAVGATVQSEMVRTVVSLSAVFLLIGLFLLDWLNIFSLFGQQYAMLGVTALGYWIVTRRHWERCYGGPDATFCLRLSADSNKAYRHEFFTYSHPLFVQALLIFLMAAAERWLLQWFDGSAEQGYFALGHKVCLACLMFVSAMTPLVMRELSIAWGQRDLQLMGRLVNRFAPLIYAVAAYFACFSMAEGPALVRIFGGAEFTAAILPVQIMALYPLHQSYLQLASSVFHASGRTRELRNASTA